MNGQHLHTKMASILLQERKIESSERVVRVEFLLLFFLISFRLLNNAFTMVVAMVMPGEDAPLKT